MSRADIGTLEGRLVLDAIHARYGYDFRAYAQPTIRRRLDSALTKAGLAHLGELQHRLLADPAFFRWLLDNLTVQVSDMFRDPGFYRAFRERVVPVLRTYPWVKIWHAGCATGEEVYSTAILLEEEGLYSRAQLYATDVSPGAVQTAKQGTYDEVELDRFVENYRDSGGARQLSEYYTRAYGRVAVREPLRRQVVFFEHDLGSDQGLGEMHVVFCRNVLIYFGAELRARALELFRGALVRGGFLCLGSNETLPPAYSTYFSEFSREHRIYRRSGEQ